jgi:hypothetical protein
VAILNTEQNPEARKRDGLVLLTDLEEFLVDHRSHGTITGDATELACNGYLLSVGCPCGVTFERWVTPQDAAVDLPRADLRTGWN